MEGIKLGTASAVPFFVYVLTLTCVLCYNMSENFQLIMRYYMKKRDILYIVLFIVCFIGIIGVLVAWSDGAFDNSHIDNILSVIFPAFIASWIVFLVIINWFKRISSLFITFIIVFLICIIYMLLSRPIVLDVTLLIALSVLLLITLIIKAWLKR